MNRMLRRKGSVVRVSASKGMTMVHVDNPSVDATIPMLNGRHLPHWAR